MKCNINDDLLKLTKSSLHVDACSPRLGPITYCLPLGVLRTRRRLPARTTPPLLSPAPNTPLRHHHPHSCHCHHPLSLHRCRRPIRTTLSHLVNLECLWICHPLTRPSHRLILVHHCPSAHRPSAHLRHSIRAHHHLSLNARNHLILHPLLSPLPIAAHIHWLSRAHCELAICAPYFPVVPTAQLPVCY